MAQLTVTISPAQAGRQVRALLKQEWKLSTTCINRLKRTERGITVNGVRVFTNAVLAVGDVLTVDLAAAERPSGIVPIPLPLDIVFEDEHLLILNKSAPLAVIPSSLVPDEPTVANALADYLGEGFTFHPVNRLDRGTTGLMLVAKSGFIHERLQQALHSGLFFRRYLAICEGVPQPERGDIVLPIARKEGSAVARCVSPAGQYAHSSYRVVGQRADCCLVSLTPHTGRTHQLRVHMAAIGHPLVGDWLYGTEGSGGIARPALHAEKLSVQHPVTGEQMECSAPLPGDMKQVWEYTYHG